MSLPHILFTNQATAGASKIHRHLAGLRKVLVHGTFDGAKVVLELQTSTGAWVPVVDATWLEPDVKVLDVPPTNYRLVLSGVTVNTNISAEASIT